MHSTTGYLTSNKPIECDDDFTFIAVYQANRTIKRAKGNNKPKIE